MPLRLEVRGKDVYECACILTAALIIYEFVRAGFLLEFSFFLPFILVILVSQHGGEESLSFLLFGHLVCRTVKPIVEYVQ